MDRKYSFSQYLSLLTCGNRVILANRYTGFWMKISKECYDILKLGIEKGLSQDELISILSDDKDKLYFRSLFEKLESLGVLSVSGTEAKEEDRISQVSLAVTNRCNLSCLHCSYDARDISGKDVFSTNEMFNIIDKLIASNVQNIIFTGGEPLLRIDFADILEYTRQSYSGNITIMTNGTLIDESNVEILSKAANNIDISLDGADEESCSQLRGKGVFQRVLRSIRLLQDHNFNKISLSMVVTKENEQYVSKFMELNRTLNTRPLVRSFSPIGRGAKNKERLGDLRVYMENMPEGIGGFENVAEVVKTCSCKAGWDELFIDYEGSIYPCPLLSGSEYRMGNVNDMECLRSSMPKVGARSADVCMALKNIQPDEFHKCRDCNVNLFCWSCLHHIDMLRDNEDEFNERCRIKKAELTKTIWG